MRLWVTGWGGMLGSHVYRAAAARGHAVRGSLHKDCLIEDVASVWKLAQLWMPDAIINCVGALPGATPLEMAVANALGPHVLATLQIRLIHMSTDSVGSADLYSRTKLAGESEAPHVLNVRGTFIGKEAGFLRWLLEAEGEVEAWDNAEWAGTTVDVMAEKLVELAEGDRTGAAYAASPKVTSKAWMVEMFVRALNLPVTVAHKAVPRVHQTLEPDVELPDAEETLRAYAEGLKP